MLWNTCEGPSRVSNRQYLDKTLGNISPICGSHLSSCEFMCKYHRFVWPMNIKMKWFWDHVKCGNDVLVLFYYYGHKR